MIELETIGNATLILSEDDCPILSSDVWLDDYPAYFGSWALSHEVPLKQRHKISKCKYIFISHFHPDHLNLASLRGFKNATILLAQHYGSRLERDLRNAGFTVINLPSRKWIQIAKSLRIMLFNNELQDSALIVEVDVDHEKSLILNMNDSAGIGFSSEVSSLSAKYKNSFWLSIHGYGDANMINLFDVSGRRIEPLAAKKKPVGVDIFKSMKRYSCNYAIPFSSFHQYQRSDSFWANKYTTPLTAYSDGFPVFDGYTLLPAFQRIQFDASGIHIQSIAPPKKNIVAPLSEALFGDDWSVSLSVKDLACCTDYFQSIFHIVEKFARIELVVGGVLSNALPCGKGRAVLRFEVPRKSLMRAVRREVFDDLLIGNFMKTTLVRARSLYSPDFTRVVAKYADNGRVKTPEELKSYFAYYNEGRIYSDQLQEKITKIKAGISGLIPGKGKRFLKDLIHWDKI